MSKRKEPERFVAGTEYEYMGRPVKVTRVNKYPCGGGRYKYQVWFEGRFGECGSVEDADSELSSFDGRDG